MLLKKSIIQPGLRTSPWIILGTVAILVAVVLILAVLNIQRERRHMTQVLTTKGAALIRAVEAGTRTGMKGLMWGGRHVQRLLEETAQLPDVRYVAVIRLDGTILAHSDAGQLGKTFRDPSFVQQLGPDFQENHMVLTLDNGDRVFEVHRYFKPMVRAALKRHMMGPPGRGNGGPGGDGMTRDWFNPQRPQRMLIVAGLELAPFEESIQRRLRNTIVLSVLLLLLGFAGFVAMFWMQSYRTARRSLQDTSVFANEVVAHLPVGLIATDPQGRIAFFNAAAEQIIGAPRHSAIGKMPEKVLPKRVVELLTLLDQSQIVREEEMVWDLGDRRAVPVSVSANRIVNELDHLVGHVVMVRDLSEVQRLRQEIQRQEKLAALGGLAAGVAHEIRNPLSSIKGMATYLANRFCSNGGDRQAADVMVQEVDRLNRVISELLEFARPSDITIQTVDLPQLLQHSLRLIQQDADANDIQVELNIQTAMPKADIDPDRISQCLLNLYLNAIAAMPDGGRLEVVCRKEASGDLVISVGDSGGGIDDDRLSEIFNPYFTTKSTGTGLGLAIVHKIVEAHQGRIGVQSTPNGTTFSLHLPPNPTGGEHA
jgi:two-component system sensor histidine kinase HydH